MYLDLFIKKPIRQIDQLYTYSVPSDLEDQVEVGKRCQVSFGRGDRQEIGYIIGVRQEAPSAKYEIKAINQVLDERPILSQEAIDLGLFMRRRYLTSYVQAFSPLLPEASIGSVREGFVPLDKKSPQVQGLFRGRDLLYRASLAPEEEGVLEDLLKKGQIKRVLRLRSAQDQLYKDYYQVTDKEKPKLSKKQEALYEFLSQEGPKKRKDILEALGISDSPIKTLEGKGLIERVHLREDLLFKKEALPLKEAGQISLNKDQAKAYGDILKDPQGIHLLHGVTGSGKTEVYIKLTRHMLERGQGLILILPEISLTPMIRDRFKRHFGSQVSILHSRLSQKEKAQEWVRIRQGQAKIVIGARSAVFAPLENLGMIIIDEEHEESYGFHNQLRYDTKEVAEKRSQLEGAGLLLGSATPSVTSYYRARKKDIQLHQLKHRAVEGAQLPQVHIVDMREELARGNVSIFSQALYQELGACLERKDQAILFLNRRGYSHFMSCRSCGHVVTCDHCDISMSYHQSIGRLLCHYCGSTKPRPTTCPQCGSPYIKEFGVGTEQLEDLVKEAFPQARVARMDRDTMNQKDRYEEVYQAMKKREIDILLGTQMLTKGFDFERVTLVGAIAADTSLNFPTYNAAERTFQLLTQVSGRAGRSQRGGQVFIQTYQPDHYSLKRVQNQDYLGFYEEEIQGRKILGYPPFAKLFYIRLSGKNQAQVEEELVLWQKTLTTMLEKVGLHLYIGQATQRPRIKNHFSYQIQVKCPNSELDLLLYEFRRVLNNYYMNINKKGIKIDILVD
ncbi:MAG: primosomal protein N' [Tissierellia bacterium]|nr:primosomal protein N' [Tissierellia bacterium]